MSPGIRSSLQLWNEISDQQRTRGQHESCKVVRDLTSSIFNRLSVRPPAGRGRPARLWLPAFV
jgi:hypothetical protein